MSLRFVVPVVLALVSVLTSPARPQTANACPAIETVEIGKNREFRVNGKPFFPIMLWLQSHERIDDGLKSGINTFCANGGSLSKKDYLDQLARNGLYGIVHFQDDHKEVLDHSHRLGWIHGDEPDMTKGKNVLLSPPRLVPRTLPEDVIRQYRQIKTVDPVRPVLVTFTGSFFEKASRYDEATRKALYPEYVKGSDVAGFDIYPIFGSSYPSRLNWVADATEQLVRIAGPQRPIYAWIETNKGSRWMTYSKQLDVEPKHTRCETWMAIIRGATAIGYFTHRWQPDYKQFAPEKEMVAELKRLNGQITRLAPAILATQAKTRIKMTLNGGLPCHFKATDCQGALHIFAQNIDLGPEPESKRQFEQIVPRAGQATITVEGLKAGTSIEVIDEHRTIKAADGKFTDDFAPLSEHIYRLSL